jgi:7-cyano-7-deazaguanine synthase
VKGEISMDKKDLVILFSGGSDSMLMLKLALDLGKNPLAVLIDYGQVHVEELEFAKKQLKKLKVDLVEVKVDNPIINSGLTGNHVQDMSGAVHEMHVPGRNSVFLSLAFSIAENEGIDTIWLGSDWSDRLNLFPDCYQEYIVKINELFKIAGPKEIKVEAPLMGWTKEMVISYLYKKYSIMITDIFSGYEHPEPPPKRKIKEEEFKINKYKVQYYENGILNEKIIEASSYENTEYNGVFSTVFTNVFNTPISAVFEYSDVASVKKIEEGETPENEFNSRV